MTTITFERESLYEEVWTTPLTTLGKKYGLSDNGLRKVCKAMNIPLPIAGHWARVAAGRRVAKLPLPEESQRTTFVSRPGGTERSSQSEDDARWLAARTQFEEAPENLITIEMHPRCWHQAVAPLRSNLLDAVRDMKKVRRDAERGKKMREPWNIPDYRGGYWQPFLDRGQILAVTHKSMPMRVGPETYERALATLNGLCRAAEERNFSVTLSTKLGRIVLKSHEATVGVRITERLSDTFRTDTDTWDKKPRRILTKTPTGHLRLYVGERYSEQEVSDARDRPLETRLNEVFVRVYRHIVRSRAAERQREAWWAECRAEEERREAEEARRREEEARIEAEKRRRRALIVEAKQWNNARLIREYVAYLRSTTTRNGEKAGSESISDWLSWAAHTADELDPTTRRLQDS